MRLTGMRPCANGPEQSSFDTERSLDNLLGVPEALEVTWEFGGHVSWVHVRLAQAEGGTRLTLEHLIPKDEASEEHRVQYGPGAAGVGWDLSFLEEALDLASSPHHHLVLLGQFLGAQDGDDVLQIEKRKMLSTNNSVSAPV